MTKSRGTTHLCKLKYNRISWNVLTNSNTIISQTRRRNLLPALKVLVSAENTPGRVCSKNVIDVPYVNSATLICTRGNMRLTDKMRMYSTGPPLNTPPTCRLPWDIENRARGYSFDLFYWQHFTRSALWRAWLKRVALSNCSAILVYLGNPHFHVPISCWALLYTLCKPTITLFALICPKPGNIDKIVGLLHLFHISDLSKKLCKCTCNIIYNVQKNFIRTF